MATFNGANGYAPYGTMAADADGNLYGLASVLNGSTPDLSIVFEVAAGTHDLTTLADFSVEDADPLSNLIVDANGNVYGTTGAMKATENPNGSVYEIVAGTQSINTLYSFDGVNGNSPPGGLAEIRGSLYGSTVGDDEDNSGTLYKLSPQLKEAKFTGTQKVGNLPIDNAVLLCETYDSSGYVLDNFAQALGNFSANSTATFSFPHAINADTYGLLYNILGTYGTISGPHGVISITSQSYGGTAITQDLDFSSIYPGANEDAIFNDLVHGDTIALLDFYGQVITSTNGVPINLAVDGTADDIIANSAAVSDGTGSLNSVGILTWDNSSGTGDGVTWDIQGNQNWSYGTPYLYYDGLDVVFNDDNNGNYAVTLNTTVSPASVTVDNSDGNYIISGTGSIAGTGSLTKQGTGTLTLLTANTYSGGTFVDNGTLIVGVVNAVPSNTVLNIGSVLFGTNQIVSSGTVVLAAQSATQPSPLVTLSGLNITSGSTLDITNNYLVIDYAYGSDPIATIRANLVSGYNNGTWNGTGIISSLAATSGGKYAIGYADGGVDQGTLAAPDQVLLKYTLVGDANLDGTVNLTDLLALLNNYGQTGRDWADGDFNYDGTVNLTDLLALLNNYGQSAVITSASLGSAQVVPEPATLGLLALAGMDLLRRRRRRMN